MRANNHENGLYVGATLSRVPIPIGDYNPDWAVLLEKDGSRKLYFILETKGSTNLDMDVRKREHLKINCGERHFASLANDIEQRSAKTWSEFKDKI